MISFGNFGTGKILYSSLKVHCKSPHSWPSSCGKKQFLHSRLRRSWRNCFSPRLLTHSWGDLQCTFRDSQKILNSYTRGFATRIGIFQSQNCQIVSLGQWPSSFKCSKIGCRIFKRDLALKFAFLVKTLCIFQFNLLSSKSPKF